MKFNKFLCASILLVAPILLAACSGKSGNSGDDTLASEMPAMDTTPLDTVTNDAGEPYIRFKSADEAIAFMNRSGHAEQYSKGIIPQIARENLEYAEKLLNNSHPRFIVVDKKSMNVILYDKYGVEIEHYGCACARNYGTKHRKADSRTPEGFFSVEGIYNSTDWLFTDDYGHTSPARGVYGPRFIRLKIPNTTQIGIHGTSSPGSIGRRTSHGCIRLTNENIMKLVPQVEKGMPVIVSPGPADIAANKREGVDIYAVNTGYESFKRDEDAAKRIATQKEVKKSEATKTTAASPAGTDSVASAPKPSTQAVPASPVQEAKPEKTEPEKPAEPSKKEAAPAGALPEIKV